MRDNRKNHLMSSKTNGVGLPLKQPYYCPYCGKKMKIEDASVTGTVHHTYENRYGDFQKEKVLICTNYPECDTYGRVRFQFGEYYLLSVPAHEKVRSMRKEVHHYEDILLANGIYANLDELYEALSKKLIFFGYYTKHVGDCDEEACKIAGCFLADQIIKNEDKIKKFKTWPSSNILSDEQESKMEAITERLENDRNIPPYDRFFKGRIYPATVINKTDSNIFVHMRGLYTAMIHINELTKNLERGDKIKVRVEAKYDNKQYIIALLAKEKVEETKEETEVQNS